MHKKEKNLEHSLLHYSLILRKKVRCCPSLKGIKNAKSSARTRIRTEDLMITSHALYQLSHASELLVLGVF